MTGYWIMTASFFLFCVDSNVLQYAASQHLPVFEKRICDVFSTVTKSQWQKPSLFQKAVKQRQTWKIQAALMFKWWLLRVCSPVFTWLVFVQLKGDKDGGDSPESSFLPPCRILAWRMIGGWTGVERRGCYHQGSFAQQPCEERAESL